MYLVTRGERREAANHRVEVGDGERRRKRERQEAEPRGCSHRGQVAEVDGQRAVSDGGGRRERAVEVHAFNQRVDTQDLELVPLRLHHRRIVADADRHPGGRRRKVAGDASDELALGEIRNRHLA